MSRNIEACVSNSNATALRGFLRFNIQSDISTLKGKWMNWKHYLNKSILKNILFQFWKESVQFVISQFPRTEFTMEELVAILAGTDIVLYNKENVLI